LTKLLGTEEDQDVVLRIIGSLVAIGDEAAVKPMIDWTSRKDQRLLLQIIFAVSSLGGRTAEGFLVTLASGHPSEEIQQGAKDALAELQRRSGSKGAR